MIETIMMTSLLIVGSIILISYIICVIDLLLDLKWHKPRKKKKVGEFMWYERYLEKVIKVPLHLRQEFKQLCVQSGILWGGGCTADTQVEPLNNIYYVISGRHHESPPRLYYGKGDSQSEYIVFTTQEVSLYD